MVETSTVTEITTTPSPLHESQGMEESMPKLSEEARKKIADAVRKSWAARRAKQAGAKQAGAKQAGAKPAADGRGTLSAAARRKIAAGVKRAWAARRAGQVGAKRAPLGRITGGAILSAVEQAAKTLRKATVEDIRPLAGQRSAARQLDELASLASELKRLISA
jgi:hypothetical protein